MLVNWLWGAFLVQWVAAVVEVVECGFKPAAHGAGARQSSRPATLSSRQIDRYTRVHQSLCTRALGRVQLQVLFNFHSAPIILQQPVGKG